MKWDISEPHLAKIITVELTLAIGVVHDASVVIRELF